MNECSVFLDASGLLFDVLKLLFLLNQSWLICKELADSLQAACPTRNSLFSNHLITSTSHQSQPLHHICSFNRVTCCFRDASHTLIVLLQFHLFSFYHCFTWKWSLKKCCHPRKGDESNEMSSWSPKWAASFVDMSAWRSDS